MLVASSQTDRPPLISQPILGPRRWLWFLSAVIFAGLVILYFFNPVAYSFYPSCQFYQLTHLHCPGCGSLRALHQLTHGHIGAAFLSNPLLIASLPALTIWGIREWCGATHPSVGRFLIRPAAIWIGLGVIIAFGILRNLPGPAFSWMAP